MKKWLVGLLTAASIFTTALSVADTTTTDTNKPQMLVPASPKINAKGYVLMDAHSGKIIAEHNMNKRMAPASLTKMMTLYIVSDALKNGTIHLDDKVRVSKSAHSRGGSKMFIKEGEDVPVKDLIHGVIVQSGNDACVALAEFIAGNESTFASLMNQTAAKLGMKDSHFTDSTGLPHPNHYTTPHDMAVLAAALVTDFPQYYHWYSQKWFTYNGIKQPNRNRLLWRYKYADGIKTGHTEEAGYCLVSSAQKDGMRLISVVMGAPTDNERAQDSQALFTYGFRFFDTYKLYTANEAITKPRVYGGKKKSVPVGVKRDVYVTLPRGQYDNLKAITNIKEPIKAPVKKNQVMGDLQVNLYGDQLVNQQLVALSGDPKGGMWTRMTDSIGVKFHKKSKHNDDSDEADSTDSEDES